MSLESESSRSLLQLTARGSAILAELGRLSEHIPAALIDAVNAEGQKKAAPTHYSAILFDFRYLRSPELYDSRINASPDLLELDDEFQQTYDEVLARFYTLFESIHRFVVDYTGFLDDLSSGRYVHSTVESVLLDEDGKRLMCEALYLLGVIYLFMDLKVPGPIRERLIIAHYRYKGEGLVTSIEEVAQLCRSTGKVPGGPRPEGYPEVYFSRFRVDETVVHMIIDRMRSDDVYDLTRIFPLPAHRSSALSQQASMLYVSLFFAPDILNTNKPYMREIVDKHFNDNWVIPVYMGVLADLSREWAYYPAARDALALDALQLPNVKRLIVAHRDAMLSGERDVDMYLTEGVLTEQYVVDNINPLLNCLRKCNVSLRWILLHRSTVHKKFRELIVPEVPPQDRILTFLLKASQLEWVLKKHFRHLLETKEDKWNKVKTTTATMLRELSEYFSGEKALTRVTRDEHLMGWFATLADAVAALDFENATVAGRTIQGLIKALEDCEQFDVIDTSTHIKEFLQLARQNLVNMVRTVNVREEVMGNIETISDLSYAWVIMNDFMKDMHQRIQQDPSCIIALRALFLKLTSVLDLPLARISQAESKDTVSVAEHYSSELVAYVRRTMEIIPVIVFDILRKITVLQTQKMREMPVRLELAELRTFAQMEERFELAQHTHRVSVFTEGILAMETTLLGVIEVNPRAILNDGIRKHLVRQLAGALDKYLVFDLRTGRSRDPKASVVAQLHGLTQFLSGFKRSFEYIQDYISMYGLKMWQEEYSRIMAFNVEQECNRFVKRRVTPKQSKHQSRAIPIPVYRPTDPKAANFLGRTVKALLALTDPRRTIFSPACSGWFDATGRELFGQGLLKLLKDAVGVHGLTGLDTLLSFRASRDLNLVVNFYAKQCTGGLLDLLSASSSELAPLSACPKNGLRTYLGMAKKLSKMYEPLLGRVLRIGQTQIMRREIAHELAFGCQLDSKLLAGALTTLNQAVLNDIRRHYHAADKNPYPAAKNPLLPELTKFLEAAGIHDPVAKIYLTCEPQPFIALWLVGFTTMFMSKLSYDKDFDTLVRKKGSDPIDGTPFVFGMATLLKQLHPSVTRQYLAHFGQFVRLNVAHSFSGSKPSPLSLEIVNSLLFLRQLGAVAHIPRRVLDAFIPSYILDAATVR